MVLPPGALIPQEKRPTVDTESLSPVHHLPDTEIDDGPSHRRTKGLARSCYGPKYLGPSNSELIRFILRFKPKAHPLKSVTLDPELRPTES